MIHIADLRKNRPFDPTSTRFQGVLPPSGPRIIAESGRPPCGFWDGSASAHRMHARITASSWDTFDQATAEPSEPLLS